MKLVVVRCVILGVVVVVEVIEDVTFVSVFEVGVVSVVDSTVRIGIDLLIGMFTKFIFGLFFFQALCSRADVLCRENETQVEVVSLWFGCEIEGRREKAGPRFATLVQKRPLLYGLIRFSGVM